MQEGATGQNNHDDVGTAVQAVSVEMQSRQNDDGVRQDGHGAEYDSDETPSPSSSSPSPSSASGGGTASQRVLVPMVPQVLVQVVQQGSPGVNIAVNVQQNLLQGLIWVFPSIEDTPLVNFTSRRKGELWGFDTRTSEQTDLRESEAITFRYSVWRSPSVI